VTPGDKRDGDLAFDITTEKLADGSIRFHVVVSK
jgi:hypothetical protein